MKKAFIAACLLLCLIPSVGMLFFSTTKTSENKKLAEFPQKLSHSVFQEFETWFTQHMALRNPMVYADAKLQSVFGMSNVDGVILGEDGWLYYSDTLEDYQGKVMSERQLFNLEHNFSLIAEYLEQQGIGFVLTIAPNKNTLYGEHMPYYYGSGSTVPHSAQKLELDEYYLDLFRLFEAREETLYLKTDSHWNGKGAYLVYSALMEKMGLAPKNFGSPREISRTDGDLNRMLYSFYGDAERDYAYDVKNWGDVEQGWLTTENEAGSGTLLMFRDSFANNLIPFFSETFAKAYYSKGQPNLLELYLEQYAPSYVVIQKVERNISDYLDMPPVITGVQTQLPDRVMITDTQTTILCAQATADTRYWQISGQVDPAWLERDTRIVIQVGDTCYRAFHQGENGFVLYLKKGMVARQDPLRVYLVNGDSCIQATVSSAELPQE